MPDQLDQELTEQQLDDLLGHLQAIEAALPMLVGLGPKEKQRVIKAGMRSQAFIRKIIAVGDIVEAYLPRNFDLETARRRIEVLDRLSRLSLSATQLSSMIEDTYALLITRAYEDGLVIYKQAKRARDIEGLDSIVAEVGKLFARPKRKHKES